MKEMRSLYMTGFGSRFRGYAFATLCLACVSFAVPVAVGASGDAKPGDTPQAESESTTSRIEPIGHWAYSRLNRSHEALSNELYDEALAELVDLERNKHLNAHERASMWQTYGYLYSAQGEQEKAVEAFEKCLAENALPPRSQLGTRKNIAQIYLMLGEHEKAIANFEAWFKGTAEPGPDAYYMLALSYAHSGDQEAALPYAEKAVELSERPHEGRLQLLTAIYFRQERLEDLIPLLQQLVTHFPKKAYWMQLSGVYSQLERYEEALAVQESAYEQGLISEHREYLTLARLFLHNDVPYEAAEVLEKGIQQSVVESTEESWDLLASSYLQAREYEKALRPLARAAELAADGGAYARLGEVYLGRERLAQARTAFQDALRKGRLDDAGRVHLLLGIASAAESRYDEAAQAFELAGKFDEYADSAAQWLDHIKRERALAGEATASSKPKEQSAEQVPTESSVDDRLDGKRFASSER